MLSFFNKFFGYVYDESGNYVPYYDNLGKGAFVDVRHFLWIIITIAISIILYKIFKKHKQIGKIVVTVLLGLLLVTRLTNQIVRACIGAEVPAWRAFPFHLCTMMTFMLPLTYFCKWDKLKPAVYVLSMMGGIITIIIGDYFNSRFMTFSTLEGMSAHMILVIVPILEIALGNFSLELKDVWKPIALMLVLMGWATLGNDVFFKNYNTNYMYLKYNALPGNIGGKYYFLIYILIFFLLLAFIYGVPYIYRKVKKNQ